LINRMSNSSTPHDWHSRALWQCLFLLALAAGCTSALAAPQSLAMIRAAAERHVRAEFSELGTITAVEVSTLDPRLRLSACKKPLTPFTPNGQHRLGNTTIGIRCDDDKPWSLYVPVRIVSHVKILTAARPLPRGSILTPDDISISQRDAATLPYGFFTNPELLTGLQLKRAIRPGDVFSPAMVAPPPLIERGQIVWIAAEAGGIAVTVKGEALADAAAGERVRVRNLSSKRTIEAEATGPAMVRVP
jgi:flagella basal body P-ring formation protein FlgA